MTAAPANSHKEDRPLPVRLKVAPKTKGPRAPIRKPNPCTNPDKAEAPAEVRLRMLINVRQIGIFAIPRPNRITQTKTASGN